MSPIPTPQQTGGFRTRCGEAPPRGSAPRGSALVIVLAFVVLLTFLVVAFLTRSQTDFVASNNYSKSMQAEEVAQLGSSFLISGLQQEIREAMSVPGGRPEATVWPARSILDDPANGGDSASSTVNERDPREFSLFRVSGTSAPDYEASYGAGTTANLVPNVASDARTDAGRRAFDPARWNAPRLLPYTPRSGSGWVNCPTWIYMTRSGPKSPTAPSPYTATLARMKDVADASNPDAVIGRFSYMMYDVGGLLDANIAGAPLSGTGLADPLYGEKGTSAFANLTALFSGVADAGDPSAFLTWRIPATLDYQKIVAGKKLGDVGMIEKGMLEAPPGGNAFFSRQDLIKFSNDNPDILRGGRSHRVSGGADADSGLLKFLRTRSRSANAPMIDAALPYPPVVGDPLRAAADTTITRYKVHGDSGAESDNYVIAKDEPIFQRKFPLSRTRWFSNNDEKGQPKSGVTTAIKQHFGLILAVDLKDFTTSPEWAGVPGFVYTSPDATTPATKIKTLAEVAALPTKREPDFFEWLKAAIDPDTLGVNGGMTCSTVALPQDQSKDFQIIQIGANILDQVDVNDLPTLILTKADNVSDRNNQPLVAIGVENLPFINELIVSFKRAGEWSRPLSNEAETLQAWLQPEIWMPHYDRNPKSKRAGYNSEDEIDTFRMRVVDGEGWLNIYAEYTSRGASGQDRTLTAIRNASNGYRTIVPRKFQGGQTKDAGESDDSMEFSIADEDFSDPKIPGQSVTPNAYYNGPWNQGAKYLRQVFAGPEPGKEGFKGIFAGKVKNSGIVPGENGGKDYVNRVYPFAGGKYNLNRSEDGCFEDPTTGEDLDGDGLPDPGTAALSLPMGERYYNKVHYVTRPSEITANKPAGNPRPLTVVLEAKVQDAWVPIQTMESVLFTRDSGIAAAMPNSYASASNDGLAWGTAARDNAPNILLNGEMIPGFSFVANSGAQGQSGNTLLYATGAQEVPERLNWCRPILPGEDPDPGNNIYPIGGSPALKAGKVRNDSDTRNPNEFAATNKPLAGKVGAGGGNEQRFSWYFFGWSNRLTRVGMSKVDPRTRRFGQGQTSIGASGGSSIRPTAGVIYSDSADPTNPPEEQLTNWDLLDIGAPGSNWFTRSSSPAAGQFLTTPKWLSRWMSGRPYMAIGDLMKNIASGACSYEDFDNKLRPADYAYVPDTELPTLPLASYPNTQKSRPVILNRMFRSPAELGQVFRDVPWKNLDFFSEASVSGTVRTPTSGDTALLDVFCIEDTGLSAGKVDPNKAPKPVLEALISGALEYPGRDAATVTDALIDQTEIQTIVDQFVSNVSYNVSDPLSSMSLGSDSDVVTSLMACDAVKPTGIGSRKQKSAVEAVIRGLSGSTDTRTWNIFIDIVAEAGRLPVSAASLGDFAPSAQRRYWIFAALDRVTGRILDYHYEVVND